MALLAANITDDTLELLNQLLSCNKFVKFALLNKLNLHDNTVLLRTALTNLFLHLPEDIDTHKSALIKPAEFDDFLLTAVTENNGCFSGGKRKNE